VTELLVPRRTIHFKALPEGRFIPLRGNTPPFLQQPMVRSLCGDIKGYESGYRSGLIRHQGALYKIKGCRPEPGQRLGQPRGTQTLATAHYEVDSVLERSEVFVKEGFEYPIIPIGIWVYDHHFFDNQPTAATIYQVKGDTRMDEFIWWAERAPLRKDLPGINELQNTLMTLFGLMSGKLLRVLHNHHFTWDADRESAGMNAHAGNIVIFPGQDNLVKLALVDFDNSIDYKKIDPKELSNELVFQKMTEYKRLEERILEGWVFSRSRTFISNFPLYEEKMIHRFFKAVAPELSTEDITKATNQVLKDSQLESLSIPRKAFTNNLFFGYNRTNHTDKLSLRWSNLARIVRLFNESRTAAKLTIMKEYFGSFVTDEKTKKLAEKI
jgi:hypothetical protein